MKSVDDLIKGILAGDFKVLARALTLVENDIEPSSALLRSLIIKNIPVVGITGPPGAGKSTLVNTIINSFLNDDKRIAVLAVDPTSPFNFGSLLGDRVRMSQQFNKSNVFIRSVATRGALGGISVKTLEMLDILKASNFDLILVETVGVGQSEVEIAGLADKTIVVLVPESGDEIQNIKSGLMEIAQAFVVNKADRDGANNFANNLKKMVHQQTEIIPVFKTVADKGEGIEELLQWILTPIKLADDRKRFLLADKALKLIQHYKMKDIDQQKLRLAVDKAFAEVSFNVYQFAEEYLKRS
ncbi:methylmalonyl Co-A mutase-associated GTPase MeaB [Pedobacter namyangjuensis]|uniref:methylmalonyl Co-A mutase-associated GTPase MeaB n=1 Tax=Pedobacter namyangjuensis TaxID=600626 RepID=UPI000DE56AFD|nr:methylmalonyl Co-A mutase-associated GTPase MeaB [Pedobacter namyangjuensis]